MKSGRILKLQGSQVLAFAAMSLHLCLHHLSSIMNTIIGIIPISLPYHYTGYVALSCINTLLPVLSSRKELVQWHSRRNAICIYRHHLTTTLLDMNIPTLLSQELLTTSRTFRLCIPTSLLSAVSEIVALVGKTSTSTTV